MIVNAAHRIGERDCRPRRIADATNLLQSSAGAVRIEGDASGGRFGGHVRILILNQYFRPDQAASAHRLTDLAEDLARDHDVIALVGRPSYNQAPDRAADAAAPAAPHPHIRVRYVPSTSFARYRRWPRIVNYLTYLGGALAMGLVAPRPDVIVAATDPPLVSVVAAWISRLRRVPFVHLLWDVQPDVAIAAGLIGPGLVPRLLARLNRAAIRRATIVVPPTEAMAATAIALGVRAARVHTVSHWEDLDIVRLRPKRNAFSVAHGLADRFVVMYSGNHGLTQELDRYLALADRLRDLPDVLLVFVGDGASKRALRARVDGLRLDNVKLMPYASRAALADSLASADVCLAPLGAGLTRFMLPSKLYTILASGRPFIAAIDASSDLRVLAERHRCGFVVDPGDVDAIADRVRWLHAHPDERREMGTRARQAAESHYARTVVTPQFAAILKQFERLPVESLSPVP
jgi:colanic acid biosynthesis glycosyl transferase WcaI